MDDNRINYDSVSMPWKPNWDIKYDDVKIDSYGGELKIGFPDLIISMDETNDVLRYKYNGTTREVSFKFLKDYIQYIDKEIKKQDGEIKYIKDVLDEISEKIDKWEDKFIRKTYGIRASLNFCF